MRLIEMGSEILAKAHDTTEQPIVTNHYSPQFIPGPQVLTCCIEDLIALGGDIINYPSATLLNMPHGLLTACCTSGTSPVLNGYMLFQEPQDVIMYTHTYLVHTLYCKGWSQLRSLQIPFQDATQVLDVLMGNISTLTVAGTGKYCTNKIWKIHTTSHTSHTILIRY